MCHCGSGYIGRTIRRLKVRITEHEPSALFNNPSQSKIDNDDDSAIAEHLMSNPVCLANYSRQRFSVIVNARSDYHLRMLEAVYITSLQPVLCRQKRFVSTLQLFRGCGVCSRNTTAESKVIENFDFNSFFCSIFQNEYRIE